MKNVLKWIINVGLSGAVWYFLDKIPMYSRFEGLDWEWLMENRFSWLDAISFVTIFLIIAIAISYLSKKISRTKNDPIKSTLRQFDQMDDSNSNVLITWDVVFGQLYDKDPHATNIQIFCKNHGDVPYRMINGRCDCDGCSNGDMYFEEHSLKNEIESHLLHMKRDLIKKYKQ